MCAQWPLALAPRTAAHRYENSETHFKELLLSKNVIFQLKKNLLGLNFFFILNSQTVLKCIFPLKIQSVF